MFSLRFLRVLHQYSIRTDRWRGPMPHVQESRSVEPPRTSPSKDVFFVRDHNRLLVTAPETRTIQTGLLDLVDENLAARLREYFANHDINTLNRIQELALPVFHTLRAGLLVVAPTATGKTLLYSLAALLHVAQSTRYVGRQAPTSETPRRTVECKACGLDMSVVRMCPEMGRLHPVVDETAIEQMGSRVAEGARSEPLVVILAPTRELVQQVYNTLVSIGGKFLRVSWFSGACTREEQIKHLHRRCDIVVSTPARLYRLWKSGQLALQSTEMYLFDEIDRLLESAHIDAVQPFLDRAQNTRSFTAFFCSTIPHPVRKIIERHFKNAETRFLEICPRSIVKHNLEYAALATPAEHHVLMTTQTEKTNCVLRILEKESIHADSRIIIFCNSVRTVNFLTIELFSMLAKRPLRIFSLHQKQIPERRTKALTQFQSAGGESILVTTGVTSRGIDYSAVDHVIHFDLPTSIEEYIHRCGRASRAQQKGYFFSLFIVEDAPLAKSLLRYFAEVRNPIEVPLKLQEYANETHTDRWKRLIAVTAPGSRTHADRTRFESHRKPPMGHDNALYPDPKIKGLRHAINPRSFDLEYGTGKSAAAHPYRGKKIRR
ncbi:DEAD/DEAH box helicase [Perkinsela sp. CCAP 1560/4]|nr:DEAD/DEAH box helicase [Perkinsela sp. CCAP 1560/4]|eukprot:KNH07304.1 DEAD/DEAH box helicase [Perkinsela sp. CCAP 1560/4]